MLKDIYIIDDFYENPNVIRDFALKSKYLKFPDDSNYPGFESENSFFAEDHKTRFKNLINKEIVIKPNKWIYGKFRYNIESALSYSDIHIDSPDWAAMIYLTKDEDCIGGLGIYKHKNTGLIEVPSREEEFEKFGCENFRDFDLKYVSLDTKNPGAWELINMIPMKFNRLVLFKGSKYFHSITDKFGSNIDNARLTHSFFFNEEK